MVKQIATSTVFALSLVLTGTAVGQVPPNTQGAHFGLSDFARPMPTPKPKAYVVSVPAPGGLLLFGAVMVAGSGALKRKV